EWCADWYGAYPTTAQTNPTGPSTGSQRMIRGGYWSSSAKDCRSASRGSGHPHLAYDGFGFRLAFAP
ncbi:MAG: formylglycine-generating enzyme family protein, partial [bacterium]